jgi:16S rRNA (cytosine967-C5)-methyltransferase
MQTTQNLKWDETLSEPVLSGKGGEHDFVDAVRHPSVVPWPDSRAGATCIELFDALQQAAKSVGFVAAMEQAGRALRAARGLHSTERRFVGDALHGMVRGLRRLRALCGERQPTALKLYLTWLVDQDEAARQDEAVRLGMPGVAGERAFSRQLPLFRRAGLDLAQLLSRRAALQERMERATKLAEPSGRAELGGLAETAAAVAEANQELSEALGDGLSYPSWLVRALLEDHGLQESLAILQAQNQRAPLTVRANLLRGERAALADRLRKEGILARATALSSCGLVLDGRVNVYGTQSFAAGLLEIQDEGSQLIAELCAPPPGAVVVDVCAGAGGKTLALGALLGNKGRIVAMDVDARKLTELQRRARRAGLSNVQTVCLREDWATGGGLQDIPDWLRRRGAERVLVDAPCSGLGVLRRHPEARWHMQPADIAEINAKQRAILSAAASLVRADGRAPGRLIYATCTLLRRENDAVVSDFLLTHPEFVPLLAKEILGSERAAALGDGSKLRLRPTVDGPDGFFAAVLRRAR